MRLSVLLIVASSLLADEAESKRLKEAADVVGELMATSDRGVPQELLDQATCVAVVPGLKKGAFIVGAKFGRGFLTCRNGNGVGWRAPAAIRVEGGSVGFQIGGSASDVIMLVKTAKGAEKMMSSRFTLGGEGEVAAGPVGRDATAQTDLQMRAEILSYSRSRGVFAGISLQGATIREDDDVNQSLYGQKLTSKEILSGDRKAPDAAAPLIAALTKYSGRAGKK